MSPRRHCRHPALREESANPAAAALVSAACGSRSTVRSLAGRRRDGVVLWPSGWRSLRAEPRTYGGVHGMDVVVVWRGIANSSKQGVILRFISAQAVTCRLMASGFSRAALPSSTGYVRGSGITFCNSDWRHRRAKRQRKPSEWVSQRQRRGERAGGNGAADSSRPVWPRAAQLAMIGQHARPCRFAADHGDNRLRQLRPRKWRPQNSAMSSTIGAESGSNPEPYRALSRSEYWRARS